MSIDKLNQLQVKLSFREMQVLKAVAAGKRYKEIAQTIYMSDRTVSVHMRNVRDKLGVQTNEQAIIQAQINGIDLSISLS